MLRRMRSLFNRSSASQRSRPVRLHVELLEDRTAPALFVVNTAADTAAGTGLSGSLRYCITQANLSAGNSIVIPPGLGMITLSGNTGLPSINQDMTIVGPGADALIVNGNGIPGYSVFAINAGTTVSLFGLTIVGGNTTGGGGINNAGTLTVDNCIISNNTSFGGGGILNSGMLTVSNCTISGNSANTAEFGGGGILNFGTLLVSNCTIAGNSSDLQGGGVYSHGTLTVNNCTITENVASGGWGGGIFSTTTLTVNNCTVADNVATRGGGIFSTATLTVNNGTIANNVATGGYGGGIYSEGTLTVTDCTISDNSAAANGGGGGIYEYQDSAAIISSTVVGNSASGQSVVGGGITSNGGTLTLNNTIVAGNIAAGGATDPDLSADVSASVTIGTTTYDEGYNLIGDGTGSGGVTNGVNGDQIGTAATPINPMLGPLENNGGPTQTMALLFGSPAINAGDPNGTGLPEFDQRGPGFARVVANRADIGAYESLFQPVPASMTPIAGPPQNTPIGFAYGTRLQALVSDSVGNPVANVPVTFTAPAAGASGTFDAFATVPTNALGIATAPAFTANLIAGPFGVVATASGVGSVQFHLTNTLLPTAITAVAGTPQTTIVNTAFSTPLTVKVTAAGNTPVAGIAVVFALPASSVSGTFAASAEVVTNAQGVATAPALTANTDAGTFTVIASVAGVATLAKFTLTSAAGIIAQVVTAAGSPQSGTVGKAYAKALQAQLVDAYGNPASALGVKVTFTVTANSVTGAAATFPGKTTTVTVTSNINGIAVAPTLTANADVGGFTASASHTGFTTAAAVFTLNNGAGPAFDPIVSGPQYATVGTVYGAPFTAAVHDAFGNPVSGARVTFSVPANGASGTFGGLRTVTAVTGADGVATAPAFSANTHAGTFVVTVAAHGVSSVSYIRLTNVAGSPATLAIVAGKSQTVAIDATFATALAVRVTDGFGNVVPGVAVRFTVQPDAVTGAAGAFAGVAVVSATANDKGVAVASPLKADGKPGAFTVIASSDGLPTATFDLTIT
jgi:hypothetical protein